MRTTNTTTESLTKPCVAVLFQSEDTSPALTSFSTSGSSDRLTKSALRPLTTARACCPEGPYDWLNPVPLPWEVA